MYLTVVSVNWGRGYDPGEFKANVLNVLEFTEDREHVVLGVQELDEEPDPAHEKRELAKKLEPGTHRVGWRTREPLLLSPGFDGVRREQITKTMGAGGAIGAPKGTGPTRFAVTCVGQKEAGSGAGKVRAEIGFGNTHPHRFIENPKVKQARQQGLIVFRQELQELHRLGLPGVWTGDMNDHHLGVVLPGERTAIHRGNDYIRFRNHPRSPIRLELVNTGHLNGTIDPHDPIWARFHVTPRAGRGQR